METRREESERSETKLDEKEEKNASDWGDWRHETVRGIKIEEPRWNSRPGCSAKTKTIDGKTQYTEAIRNGERKESEWQVETRKFEAGGRFVMRGRARKNETARNKTLEYSLLHKNQMEASET